MVVHDPEMDGKVVCVTGASGYIASWLVKLLLLDGYTVKGTVRNINDTSRFAHLEALEGAKERLHIFEANLVDDGSFDSIINGCDGVFHTASPVLTSFTDPQVDYLDPAVKGTLNVLKSCIKSPSVKRVIVTSSIAAVSCNPVYQGPDVVIDETWFSDTEFCKENEKWYWLAKTLAEKSAWKYAAENGMDLVVVNPGFVLGPLLQPTLNSTSQFFLSVLQGNHVLPDYQFVDVRDVARAHILAFENPEASGRYILVDISMSPGEVQQKLHRLYPTLAPPINGEINSAFQVSKAKAKSLGIDFIPFEVSVKDTIRSLMERNFLQL